MAYYSRKIIPVETRYKTYDGELLAIVKAFQTWQQYLEGYKHKVLVLTNHNNLCCFIKTKILSFCQVWWAQELSQYHFWIDHCKGKANGPADTLFRFPQRNRDKKEKLWAENTWILHRLQSAPINDTLLGLSMLASLSPLHQVLTWRTYALPQLCWFWNLP